MKKIGFIDYYLSEWHANNYVGWIKEASDKLGADFEVAYAWGEIETSPVDNVTNKEWCEKYGVTLLDSIEEVCEKSDYIIILAPSNPETHLRYAKAVLPFGKRTYIDKTFAPDFETAKEIFEIGKKHGTPFFSTSALRYAEEFQKLDVVNNLIITGGGGNLPEYCIHLIEMAVLLLNDRFSSLKVEKQGKQRIIHISTENDKKATLIYGCGLPYTVSSEQENEENIYLPLESDFFAGLLQDIVKFFKDGVLPFDTNQTLEVMRLRDTLLAADN